MIDKNLTVKDIRVVRNNSWYSIDDPTSKFVEDVQNTWFFEYMCKNVSSLDFETEAKGYYLFIYTSDIKIAVPEKFIIKSALEKDIRFKSKSINILTEECNVKVNVDFIVKLVETRGNYELYLSDGSKYKITDEVTLDEINKALSYVK